MGEGVEGTYDRDDFFLNDGGEGYQLRVKRQIDL